jgi:hypothetical protein
MPAEAPHDAANTTLPELDWGEIAAPGCYLHLVSGLLARVFAEELVLARHQAPSARENRVVRLSNHPGTSLATLRVIAARHGYPVHF